MQITAIKQQVKNADRYSIYVNDEYAFSLSADALLEHRLAPGDELTKAEVDDFKRLSAEDKVYGLAQRYMAMRPRSKWEFRTYLQRKDAPPQLISLLEERFVKAGFLDDEAFARAFVADRRLLKPSSNRKLSLELRKKQVDSAIVNSVLAEADEDADSQALKEIIERKQRQSRYADPTKLMQYLARQGFRYDDIRRALEESKD